MYYEYWGLRKPAFDNVPDPSMYADCHATMENAIAETLFAIDEGDECIAVIVGDVGLGKTLSIRMIIDSLPQERYKIALITNPGISFVQILQEIIGQLTGTQCEEKRKVNLLEMFNGILFSTLAEGKKVLIFIDEANAITPVNLESLRLLTNMQGDGRNLFTMVLAGQIEFARRLEHPKRANLFQRVGTYSRIDRLDSVNVVKHYVLTRLRLAGVVKTIFTEDAFEPIWTHSDHGVPRLINKVCKLCLKAGETNGLSQIDGTIVEQIGARFQSLTGPSHQQRKPRKRREPEMIMLPGEVTSEDDRTDEGWSEEIENKVLADPPAEFPVQAALTADGEERDGRDETDFMSCAVPGEVPDSSTGDQDVSEAEFRIGDCRIRIDLPEHLMKQSLSSSVEHRWKMAGALAAETLKKNPQLIALHTADPVPIWQEIRDFVLQKFNREAVM